MFLAVSLYLLLPLPLSNSLKVLQWNAGDLQVRSTEPLHFISSNPVELICIQESSINLSSSLRIPGFSALLCDLRNVLAPAPKPDPGSRLISATRVVSFFAQWLKMVTKRE